jgi:hypothetical protein
MSDSPEVSDAPTATAAPVPAKKHHRGRMLLLLLILIPAVIIALWSWVTLGYAYSRGERAGYVQKLSKKGWLCKTWEGELAMVNLPGSVTPQIFNFTVRSDSIAQIIETDLGKRVSLTYEEHRGIPSSCFGDTDYFVTNVRIVGP